MFAYLGYPSYKMRRMRNIILSKKWSVSILKHCLQHIYVLISRYANHILFFTVLRYITYGLFGSPIFFGTYLVNGSIKKRVMNWAI